MKSAKRARKTPFSQFPRVYHQAEKSNYVTTNIRPAAMVAIAAVLRLAKYTDDDPYIRIHFEFRSSEAFEAHFDTSFLFALPHPLQRVCAVPTLLVVPRQHVERVQQLTHFPNCTVVSRHSLFTKPVTATLALPPSRRLVLVDKKMQDKVPSKVLRAAWAIVELDPTVKSLSMRERVRRAAAASALLPNATVRVGSVPRPRASDAAAAATGGKARGGDSDSDYDDDEEDFDDDDDDATFAAAGGKPAAKRAPPKLLTFGTAESADGVVTASIPAETSTSTYSSKRVANRTRAVSAEAQFALAVRRAAANCVAVVASVRSRLGAAFADVARLSVSAAGVPPIPIVTVGATAAESSAVAQVDLALAVAEGRDGQHTRATHGGSVLTKRKVGAVNLDMAAARAGLSADVANLRGAVAAARPLLAAQSALSGAAGGGLADDNAVARSARRTIGGRAEHLLETAAARVAAAAAAAAAPREKVGRSKRKARVNEAVDAYVSGMARVSGARSGLTRAVEAASGADFADMSGYDTGAGYTTVVGPEKRSRGGPLSAAYALPL